MSDVSATGTTNNQPTATLPPGYSALPASSTSTTAGLNGLNSDTFLQLLVAQMQYQDPDDPVDSTEFLSQTASFEEVSQLDSMQTAMTSLVSSQQASTATSMLGAQVEGSDTNGNPVSGVVSGVQLTSNGPVLTVGSDTMPLSSVTSVGVPTSSTTSTTSTTSTGSTGSTGSTTPTTSTTDPQGSTSSAQQGQ